MIKTTKITLIIVIIVIIGGIWYAISNQESMPEDVPPEIKKPIKIGAILPLTGEAASYGQSWKRGVELGVEKIERKYGIEVEVLYEDSRMLPSQSATIAQKLINIDKVPAIVIGSSRETLAAAPVAESNRVLLMTSGSSPEITKSGNHIFRIQPSDLYQGRDLASLAIKKGYTRTAVLTVADDYGKGIADVFKESIEKLGGSVEIMETFLPEGFSDFKTPLKKINHTEPDAILLLAYSYHYPLILKQWKELDVDVPLFAGETIYDAEFLEVADELAEGVLFTSYTEPKTAELEEFIFLHQGKYNVDPGPYSAGVYDNTLLVLQALIENDSDVEKAKEWLYNVKNWRGATGITNFDENGDPIGKSYTVYEIKNGEFLLYED